MAAHRTGSNPFENDDLWMNVKVTVTRYLIDDFLTVDLIFLMFEQNEIWYAAEKKPLLDLHLTSIKSNRQWYHCDVI